jgi:hypothetical protein
MLTITHWRIHEDRVIAAAYCHSVKCSRAESRGGEIVSGNKTGRAKMIE